MEKKLKAQHSVSVVYTIEDESGERIATVAYGNITESQKYADLFASAPSLAAENQKLRELLSGLKERIFAAMPNIDVRNERQADLYHYIHGDITNALK